MMNIVRDTTGELTHGIINNPEVRHALFGSNDPVNMRPLSEGWILMVGDPPLGVHGCRPILEGVYVFHSAVVPASRGGWTLEFTKAAIRHMFTTTDCIELITGIPAGTYPATALARAMGFTPRWSVRTHLIWSLTAMEWMPSELGDFHEVIAEMRAAGLSAKAANWERRRTHFGGS